MFQSSPHSRNTSSIMIAQSLTCQSSYSRSGVSTSLSTTAVIRGRYHRRPATGMSSEVERHRQSSSRSEPLGHHSAHSVPPALSEAVAIDSTLGESSGVERHRCSSSEADLHPWCAIAIDGQCTSSEVIAIGASVFRSIIRGHAIDTPVLTTIRGQRHRRSASPGIVIAGRRHRLLPSEVERHRLIPGRR
jgi:hypothetical protein